MRIVAAQTPLARCQRFVLELNGLGLGADILVAFETQLIAGFVE